MWHQWFNLNFTKLREYFLCARKTKIMTLFNNSSPPRHPGAILGSITYVNNVCTHIRCLRSDQSVNMYPRTVLLTQNSIRCLRMRYSPKWHQSDAEEKNYWKLRLNHWCHKDYFAVYGRVRELSEFILVTSKKLILTHTHIYSTFQQHQFDVVISSPKKWIMW